MQNAAVPYVVFTISGSPGQVGVAGFFQYVPFMLMGMVGGTLADRFHRRRALIVTQVAQAVSALALYALVASGAATTGSISALAFLSGLAAGVNTPIWQAFVPDLVPRELLMNAVTLNSAQFNASRALGPFLAGVVIATVGPAAAFAINAASFGAVVAVLLVIRGRPATPGRDRTGVLGGVSAAVRHARTTPAILACCTAIIAVAGIGSPLFSYLPVYGERVFGVAGAQLGLLFGAGGIGSVLFTPLLLRVAPRLARAKLLAGSMLLYGAALVATGLAPGYPWAVVALLIYGGAYLAIASTINTTIQLVVREDLRGTVIALYLMCLTGALPVGLFVWGVVSEQVGIRPTTVGAGISLAVVTSALVAAGRFRVMAAADAARDDAAGNRAR
jgi:MFS family permease